MKLMFNFLQGHLSLSTDGFNFGELLIKELISNFIIVLLVFSYNSFWRITIIIARFFTLRMRQNLCQLEIGHSPRAPLHSRIPVLRETYQIIIFPPWAHFLNIYPPTTTTRTFPSTFWKTQGIFPAEMGCKGQGIGMERRTKRGRSEGTDGREGNCRFVVEDRHPD